MFSSNEQISLLLNSTICFCDGTFKSRPKIFQQVYIIQCLVDDEGKQKRWIFCMICFDLFMFSVFPVMYALTFNRKRKTYEEMIKVLLRLAADRNKILTVHTIVSDFDEAWLLVVEKMVGLLVFHNSQQDDCNHIL
jgi:hypothetical protein